MIFMSSACLLSSTCRKETIGVKFCIEYGFQLDIFQMQVPPCIPVNTEIMGSHSVKLKFSMSVLSIDKENLGFMGYFMQCLFLVKLAKIYNSLL